MPQLPSLPAFEEDASSKNYKLPLDILVVPLKDLVVFPLMIVTVFVKNEKLIQALQEAKQHEELIGLFAQKKFSKGAANHGNDLYDIGVSASVLQIIDGTNKGEAMVLVEGISRLKVSNFIQEDPYFIAHIQPIAATEKASPVMQPSLQRLKGLMRASSESGKNLPAALMNSFDTLEDVEAILDLSSAYLTLDLKKKQELLSVIKPEERVVKIIDCLTKEIQLAKIRQKIHTDISTELHKNEKNFLLRQELKAIKKELGEEETSGGEGINGMTDQGQMKELQQKIAAAKMPADVEKIAKQELERLKKIFPFSPEFTVARTYIEWLCDMPWNKSCPSKVDVQKARTILDEDHYGLEKIKERILEYLAVCQIKEHCGSTILCFVGPPGVGKTSLGKSIAKALGRAFIHTSLGGIRDEADIRGHRRTYVGALPGRVVQSIKRAGCNDAVFMLDEIDKIGKDFQGDPASALLEVLDPEQNNAFVDHYLDVPFNLSKVFFITTANILDPIPPALQDRMEIIELAGYTEEEKLQIVKKYLIPKQRELNGVDKYEFNFTDEALLEIIRSHTNEAGLRELDRQIGTICRKIAKELIETKHFPQTINLKNLEKYLGVSKYFFEAAQAEDMVGVATGLAWTPTGGDIIFIEAARMHGSKNLILTGSLGEVMQESARTALSYIKSHSQDFKIKNSIFEKSDLHIHVPEGATPKDGPSAGITICTALISLLTGQKIRRDVAMTGEITLTGRILPIGGLKEKILAAKRARIKTIIIPEKNEKDLVEVPKHVLKNLEIRLVKTLDDVLKIALIPSRKVSPPKFSTKVINMPKVQKKVLASIMKM